jgi:hypothetical protein
MAKVEKAEEKVTVKIRVSLDEKARDFATDKGIPVYEGVEKLLEIGLARVEALNKYSRAKLGIKPSKVNRVDTPSERPKRGFPVKLKPKKTPGKKAGGKKKQADKSAD